MPAGTVVSGRRAVREYRRVDLERVELGVCGEGEEVEEGAVFRGRRVQKRGKIRW